MKAFFAKNITKEIVLSFIGLALIAISAGYLASIYIASEEINIALNTKYEQKESMLLQVQKANTALKKELGAEKASGQYLTRQVGDLSDAVGTLQKYASTDKQLLEKYSKVFFLNENYTPEALTQIDTVYTFDKAKLLQFHTKAYPFLTKLIEQAKVDGLNLLVASSYRSFGMQSSLKSSYKVTFGAKTANSFSADQGYSEHQLGTTVDFTTQTVGGGLNGFEKTKEYQWLNNNAYKYGFILSYPESNAYYIFEPWHWRFVGIGLATRLHTFNQHFYDMDQRTINDYLGQIFDTTT